MEDWDNIMTTLMVLSGALIIGVNILIWKLGKFRKYDSRRFINYTSRGDGEGFKLIPYHEFLYMDRNDLPNHLRLNHQSH